MSYCHAVLGVRCSPQRVTRTRSYLHPGSIFMCRFGRFVVLAAGLFAAALLAHSFLVVTGGGLVTGVRGQARPGSALSTNGARGAGPGMLASGETAGWDLGSRHNRRGGSRWTLGTPGGTSRNR